MNLLNAINTRPPRPQYPVGSGGMFTPCGEYRHQPTTNLLILEQGRNPTTDYYLRPRLPAPQTLPTTFADLASDPATLEIPHGTFVIIVRYLNPAWARHLLRHRDRLSGAAYLMDDDLPGAMRAQDLPLRYRWKILRLFRSQQAALRAICDRVWVANEYLVRKYPQSGATLLPPLPLMEQWGDTVPLTYFYYGSASHRREQEWLVDVVRRVQAQGENLTFLTAGDARLRKLYAGIPRVVVLHPMPWPTYVEALPAIRHDIGLAPLLGGSFNRSRTHTKFFDFTRLGAVGIYSKTAPYDGFVRDYSDGILVENIQGAWCEAIGMLASSQARRGQLHESARARAEALFGASRVPVGCPEAPV